MKRIIIPLILTIMFVPFIVNAETLSVTDCNNNKLNTTVPSKLKGLAKIMAQNAYLDNGQSEFVSSCEGVQFNDISSDTNGKGIYEIASTKNDTYPIYYYRGAVDNNNVKFGGFCWKAIRTTDTGGVKLIYNGEPDESGNCTNTTGESTQMVKSSFSSNNNSVANVGYMYGTVYKSSYKHANDLSSGYIYGNNVTYSNGTYTLQDTVTATGSYFNDHDRIYHHQYTCFSTENSCSTVYYIYFLIYQYPGTGQWNQLYYINLTDGKNVEDALEEMLSNKTDNKIKATIEQWYNKNLLNYTDYIEDTIYCNDRTISQLGMWDPNEGDSHNIHLYFSPEDRVSSTFTPTLECSRPLDRFTVSSTKGNGALTYPVGLITSDEAMYAGGYNYTANNSYYLYTGLPQWSMSASYTANNHYYEMNIAANGAISHDDCYTTYESVGVRPVISIKGNDLVRSGDGTANNPYFVDIYLRISIETNDKTKDIFFDVEDLSTVKEGETITFEIAPKKNYVVDGIKIIDQNNNEISFKSIGKNKYSFVMPDTDVTIKPLYRKSDTSNNTIVNPKTGITIIGLLISFIIGIYIYYVIRKKYKRISIEN